MMSVSSGRNRFPFTATQWEELEHQALIFKYMVSGMPIPPDLLFSIKRSFDSSSLPSKLILQPQHVGWNCFQMGFGRKIDPEPGRCRRTDGKKWRCSKEAYPDSKYCERHMHRGRNRSRKPVEVNINTTTTTTTASSPSTNSNMKTSNNNNNTIPISSITRNYTNPSSNFPQSNSNSSSSTAHFLSPLSSMQSAAGSDSDSQNNHHPCFNNSNYYNNHHNSNGATLHHPFLYPHSSSSSRPPGIGLSSKDNNTHFLMDSSPYSHSDKDYRYGEEKCGTMRSSMSGSSVGDSWHLEPLTMSSSSIMAHQKQRNLSSVLQQTPPFSSSCSSPSSYLQLSDTSKQDQHNYYLMGSNRGGIDLKCEKMPFNSNRDNDEPQKVMHHFFDEWPPKNEDSTTQLSISIPTTDFFMSHNDK